MQTAKREMRTAASDAAMAGGGNADASAAALPSHYSSRHSLWQHHLAERGWLSGSMALAGSFAASAIALVWQNLQRPSDSVGVLTHLPGRWPWVFDWHVQRSLSAMLASFA
jgi:hypothetical protein